MEQDRLQQVSHMVARNPLWRSPKDGIFPIDHPLFKVASEDKEVAANEPVIGLEINGDARAYPQRILIWHEIVNDVVGGTPVTVTYYPLCNSAVVFDRRVPPHVLDFGTTSKLRNSDLVMYDRQTKSWWQQFTGEALVGELTGTELKLVPARLESLAQFKTRHSVGKVLVPNNPGVRDYGRSPYVGYDMAAAPFLYRGDYLKDVEAMARVVVVRPAPGKIGAVTLEHLRKQAWAGPSHTRNREAREFRIQFLPSPTARYGYYPWALAELLQPRARATSFRRSAALSFCAAAAFLGNT
jgi:hypothetical protein